MPMLRLVEPNHFSRARVLEHCRPDAPRSQMTIRLPLKVQKVLPAMCFDFGLLLGAKYCLPIKSQAIHVIAYVGDFLSQKLFPDHRVHRSEYFAAVHQRSFAANLGWLRTMEPELHGPKMIEGIFVVPQKLLIGRISDRSVHALRYGAALVLAVVGQEIYPYRLSKLLETNGGANVKAAEIGRAMFTQLSIQIIEIAFGPSCGIEIFVVGVQYQRNLVGGREVVRPDGRFFTLGNGPALHFL